MIQDILFGLASIVVGIGASYGLYWLLDQLVNRLPDKLQKSLRAWAYLLPAATLLILVLFIPLVLTFVYSFMNNGQKSFVGFDNYVDLFTDPAFIDVLINNFLWIAFVPAFTVAAGLLFATLTNNVGPRREKVFKSLIFMPMAISFVSAATIWRFTYASVPPGRPEVGLLNAIVGAFGGKSQNWLQLTDFRLNSFLLMIIIVWLQTGFSMVLISAAIKAVPEETIEAARVDGATSIQLFWRIVLPQIWGTVMSVFITTVIMVMKIFDIVLAMTGGQFQTSVLGYMFYQEFFLNGNPGKASAIVAILTLLIIPLMVVQVVTFRRQEAMR
ncbi:MAG: Lactose transport system permease protein LacF [Actinomycetota bacterium]|jgi:alpha-glucoside transport system permease protein